MPCSGIKSDWCRGWNAACSPAAVRGQSTQTIVAGSTGLSATVASPDCAFVGEQTKAEANSPAKRRRALFVGSRAARVTRVRHTFRTQIFDTLGTVELPCDLFSQ